MSPELQRLAHLLALLHRVDLDQARRRGRVHPQHLVRDGGAFRAAVLDCCALLALPILNRGNLQALLLLENRHIRGAFTTERLDAVKLIAGQLAVSLDNAQLYTEFRRIADEQAALRRVATLVARGVGPVLVFAAVAEEVGTLLGADNAAIVRFEPDGEATVMGGYGFEHSQPGSRAKPEPYSALASVQATGRAARRDVDDPMSASLPEAAFGGARFGVASPIVVEGRLWGAMAVGSRHERLPQDTDQRLVEFTELVATAITNAESRAELTASRARIVAAADQARQRIERDLHDGAQQRLVSLALQLRTAQAVAPPELGELVTELDRAVAQATGALDELGEIARGIHPTILAKGGLRPALETLARRSPNPVDLDMRAEGRLPEHVEVSAYYVVAEALTNAAKHARASAVMVTVEVGLKDRVEALGGASFSTVRAEPGPACAWSCRSPPRMAAAPPASAVPCSLRTDFPGATCRRVLGVPRPPRPRRHRRLRRPVSAIRIAHRRRRRCRDSWSPADGPRCGPSQAHRDRPNHP
jgi:signal transduction histidine kinase